VPAILAEAQATRANGRDMIAAYVAGYEVWAELISRDQDQHHRKGWHPSAVFGPLAAASAVAVLKRLSAEQASQAVAIAASLAGGGVGNFGSMTKPFQLGRAAQSGLLAARLAEAGLTAAPDAIEHEAGFLAAISPRGRVDRESPTKFGAEWRILRHGLNLKLYPMCYGTHRILDGIRELRTVHGFAAPEIAAIEVQLGDAEATMLRNHRPRAPLEAKFSAEFAVAAMAIAGQCGSAELSEAFIGRDDVQDLMTRVSIKRVAGQNPDEPSHAPYNQVTVSLRDGASVTSGPIAHAVGNFRRPAPAEALWRKFEECAAENIGAAAARHLFHTLSELDRLASVDVVWAISP
jgi:aconitate decarboxylase